MSKYAIDCRWIFKDISGIGRYTQELVTNLSLVDMDNEYLLLFDNAEVRDRTLALPDLEEAEGMSTCLVEYGLFSPANQLKLPGLLAEKGVQVYHSTNYMTLLTGLKKRGIASIVTIHDLIPLLFPDHAPKSKKSRIFPVFKQLMKQSL